MKGDSETQFETSRVIFSFLPLVFVAWSVHAYIDPGTGSLIIQFLIAGAVGGPFLVKIYWKKVKAFLSKLFLKFRKGDG